MGWFRKNLKGSNHRVSEGRYDGETFENHPSTSAGQQSEVEDGDRAVALSLSDEYQKVNPSYDRDTQFEEDELLAMALEASLNLESPQEQGSRRDHDHSFHEHEIGYFHGHGVYHPPSFSYPLHGLRVCVGCNTEINGRFLSCLNAVWHPECLRYHGCRLPISDYEFTVYGNYPYHKACYKESYHPKCDVCHHFIPINTAGLIEYRAHPFWSQKYCPAHEHDGTARCCSCEQMESLGTKFASLKDGRSLCLECLDSAIMDTDECQSLFVDVLEFYKGLNMNINQQIPLLLVERQALNEAMDGERHGHYHMPETRGLCLSEEQTVSTIMTRPGRSGDVRSKPRRLRDRCEVTAILILYGLPRLLTGSILAHEMMHAWLRLNGYKTLRQDVEEGMCQVMASIWLESQILGMSGNENIATSSSSVQPTQSRFEKKLSVFFKHQIATDTSLVYGHGYRAGNEAIRKYGLQRTLDHIRETGNLPF